MESKETITNSIHRNTSKTKKINSFVFIKCLILNGYNSILNGLRDGCNRNICTLFISKSIELSTIFIIDNRSFGKWFWFNSFDVRQWCNNERINTKNRNHSHQYQTKKDSKNIFSKRWLLTWSFWWSVWSWERAIKKRPIIIPRYKFWCIILVTIRFIRNVFSF